ncbi:MAG: hypothetical protein SAK29_01850 [Scytonema sp. PMC 1069.18]|nr:hypothetical protein [Scytonema sp. PMC 1069.18]MEC4882298.1 hypothetical protein [Scytonema sp. PMC 1070.18]
MKKQQQHVLAVKNIELWQELSEIEMKKVRGGYKPWYCRYTGCQEDILIARFEGASLIP